MKEFFENLISTWWGILIICLVCVAVWILLSALLYKPFFKRFYDIVLSGLAVIVFSPLLLLLIIFGAIKMKGNPFFTQLRPGRRKKLSKKQSKKKGVPYGKFLRSTSLDELPELFNIFVGHMSIVGPRPLLVQYLPLYSEEQRHRHDVRPGLTGYAQVHGRNAISWDEKFKLDIKYIQKISFWKDIKILLQTVLKVFKRSGINSDTSATMEEFKGNE